MTLRSIFHFLFSVSIYYIYPMEQYEKFLICGVIFLMCAELVSAAGNKKILMVIAENNFRDEEFLIPQKEFISNGFKVTVASTLLKEATGKLGAKVKPDIEISKVKFLEYDAIVIAGGPGSKQYLWSNKILLKGINEMFFAGKVVSAICASPVVFARAGILLGREATVFPGAEEEKELEKAGAIYIKEKVTVDGKIVTANGPEASKDFAAAIIKVLKQK